MLLGGQHSDLDSYWYFEFFVQSLHEGDNNVGLLEQVSTVVALLSDTLRASTVDVNCIAIVLDKLSSRDQVIRVVCTELDSEGPVFLAWLEHTCSVFLISRKQACMEHWSVAELGAIFACHHTIGQL